MVKKVEEITYFLYKVNAFLARFCIVLQFFHVKLIFNDVFK